MSEFIYKDYACKFKFKDHEFELPLNEETAQKITDLLGEKMEEANKLKDIDDINTFYDEVMDSVDELLGEGAADTIMSEFKHPGSMELMSVVSYIVTEYNKQFEAEVEEMKKGTPQANRMTRRANRK